MGVDIARLKCLNDIQIDKAKNLNCLIFTRQKIRLSTKTKAEQLQWRRSKVIEMRLEV